MEKIVFYGTRGSSSLTSPKYMEFGGATSCVLLNLAGKHIMVDCGSGINNAQDDLKDVSVLHLFLSHGHIDHINGIPNLFSTFENKELHVWGKTVGGVSVKETVYRIMNQSLWPVRADTYKNVIFHEIEEGVKIGGVTVTTMDSNHPGGCTLFRFDTSEGSTVTAFDFCHLDGYEDKLINFASGCDTLIYDGTLTEEELKLKRDWGHSTPEDGARIGKRLGCREVYITHFGAYDDEYLSEWEERVKRINPAVCFARSGDNRDELKRMVDIGTMLSLEKDNNKLLTRIVEESMEITSADGGTLYLLENGRLEFKVLINKTKNTRLIRKDAPLSIPSVAIDGKNACATAAREKRLINIEDCYSDNVYDFSGAKEYDRLNSYLTKSVLVIPLIDEYDDVVGVLQLINAKNRHKETVAFRKGDEELLMAIANQASMAIVNASYSEKINDLLYGFVKVMSLGIDERTPYNANHTRNMVKFAGNFFDYEEKNAGPYRVDSKKRREILMSIWLHDIGKILTPIDIMNKDSRLGDLLPAIENRFERRELLLKLEKAEGTLTPEEYEKKEEERKEEKELVLKINKTGFLTPELKAELDAASEKTYKELSGEIRPIITPEEKYMLSIVKGTLSPEERSIMEGHVSLTQRFLSQLNFPKYYDSIPVYAGNHHEFLNGTGYPNRLTAKDLPWPCRLITVCDIFEALTAKDRPYKKPMPPDRAFSILYEMADAGQLDASVIAEFEKTGAWISSDDAN